jgi:hypothetical protein
MFPDSIETEVTASPTLTVASFDSSFDIIMRLAYPSSEQLVRKSMIIVHYTMTRYQETELPQYLQRSVKTKGNRVYRRLMLSKFMQFLPRKGYYVDFAILESKYEIIRFNRCSSYFGMRKNGFHSAL